MAKKNKKGTVAKAKSVKPKKAKISDKFDNELLNLANNVGVTKLNFKDDGKDSKFKFFKNVSGNHVFNSNCGSKMSNLLDLAMAIRHMKDEHFAHHVNEHKNDFANWIKDCMGEEQLANELSKYKTKFSNELLILRYIANEVNVK